MDVFQFNFVCVCVCVDVCVYYFCIQVGLESSGPIAVLSLAFVTGLGWRRADNKVRNTLHSILMLYVYRCIKKD